MGDLKDFGLFLEEAWQEKRNLSGKVSNSYADEIYAAALSVLWVASSPELVEVGSCYST